MTTGRVFTALFFATVLASCGAASAPGGVGVTSSTATVTATPTPVQTPSLPIVTLTLPSVALTVRDTDVVDISGTTLPGATLVVSSVPPAITVTADIAGHFTVHVTGLVLGSNPGTIVASFTGYANRTLIFNVQRTLSPAAAEASYKASAQSLPYPQLVKDPASLRGTVVHYQAQVFQYDTNTTTSHMLASVTNNGYGYWSDNVWLDLDPAIAAAITQKDTVEFWGDVVGAYTYTTTQNGRLTIPEIHVMYMSLIQKGS